MKQVCHDFRTFAKDKKLLSTAVDDQIQKINNGIFTTQILEERQMNVVGLDIFSKLMLDRQIFFGNEFNDDSCNLLIAQLLYLDSIDNRDISIYINSGGGSVLDGLGVVDTINFISSDVSTLCVGKAASMGAVLLSCGALGKRFTLPHGRVMIHQVSSGCRGKLSDMKIELEQTERCKNDIYNILSKNLNKPFEEIEELCKNDNWFIGQEAVDLGIVDKILEKHY